MLVSTKGRYALRLMTRIAKAGPGGKVSLREVSESEDISLKYLEQIARPLLQEGLIESVRGKGGGYRLLHPADMVKAETCCGPWWGTPCRYCARPITG